MGCVVVKRMELVRTILDRVEAVRVRVDTTLDQVRGAYPEAPNDYREAIVGAEHLLGLLVDAMTAATLLKREYEDDERAAVAAVAAVDQVNAELRRAGVVDAAVDVAMRHYAERKSAPVKPFTMEHHDDSLDGDSRRKCSSGVRCGDPGDMHCTHCGEWFCYKCAADHEEALSPPGNQNGDDDVDPRVM